MAGHTRAYILIETTVGKTRDVVSTLKQSTELVEVDAVTGPYDIIAVVEGEDLNAVGDLVTRHIHSIDGVVRTVTCLAVIAG